MRKATEKSKGRSGDVRGVPCASQGLADTICGIHNSATELLNLLFKRHRVIQRIALLIVNTTERPRNGCSSESIAAASRGNGLR
jgi:hypothetical protein